MKQNQSINAKQVMEYIQSHPDFLLELPNLLTKLPAVKRDFSGDNIVDFQTHHIKALQQELHHSHEVLQEVVQLSRDNNFHFKRIEQAILCLNHMGNAKHFQEYLKFDLPRMMGLEAVGMLVHQHGEGYNQHALTALGADYIDKMNWPGFHLHHHHIAIDGLETVYPKLYGAQAPLIKSQLCVYLQGSHYDYVEENIFSAYIGFASKEEDYFHTDQGFDLIMLLAKVMLMRFDRLYRHESAYASGHNQTG